MVATWSFVLGDVTWRAERTPPADENLIWAMETLIAGFGTQSWKVNDFLEFWDERAATRGLDYDLNVVAAWVQPIDADTMEIHDKYGEIPNVRISAAELKDALHTLARAMDELEAGESS
jgi:hypothetical protein